MAFNWIYLCHILQEEGQLEKNNNNKNQEEKIDEGVEEEELI